MALSFSFSHKIREALMLPRMGDTQVNQAQEPLDDNGDSDDTELNATGTVLIGAGKKQMLDLGQLLLALRKTCQVFSWKRKGETQRDGLEVWGALSPAPGWCWLLQPSSMRCYVLLGTALQMSPTPLPLLPCNNIMVLRLSQGQRAFPLHGGKIQLPCGNACFLQGNWLGIRAVITPKVLFSHGHKAVCKASTPVSLGSPFLLLTLKASQCWGAHSLRVSSLCLKEHSSESELGDSS